MAGEIIRLGDSTSHGGKVLEGSQTDICHGKPIAFIGHKVSCPKCSGSHTIVEGVQTTTIFGKGVAVAGMKTSCGATLVASQFTDIVAPGGGGDSAPAAAKSAASAAPAPAMAKSKAADTQLATDDGGEDSSSTGSQKKSVKRIWWSYGDDETPLEGASRHYVDLNVHVETENYASGESVDLTLANDDGSDLFEGKRDFALQLKVGPDGNGKAMNVFGGKTVVLGRLG